MSEKISVTIAPLPPIPEIAVMWTALEERAEISFFLSWTWIGTWLAALLAAGKGADLSLVTARSGQDVVGLSIFGKARGGLRSLWSTESLLHQIGVPVLDSFYIEYNDFLLAPEMAPAVRAACLTALSAAGGWRVSAALPAVVDAAVAANVRHRRLREDTCSLVDLARIPGASVVDFLAALERNTRQQIRRAIKLADSDGTLHINRVTDLASARQALATLTELHGKSWPSRKGLPGAFANPAFVQFVDMLLARGVPTGAVEVLRIETQTHVIGVLLNFVYRDRVYAYQAGFAYVDDNRFKPGLVCHALAISHYKARGLTSYHFMAGDSRYKRALSNADETLVWIDGGRDILFTRALDLCRAVWHKLRPSSRGDVGASQGDS